MVKKLNKTKSKQIQFFLLDGMTHLSSYIVPSDKQQNWKFYLLVKNSPLDPFDVPCSLRTVKETLSQAGVGGDKCFSIDVVQMIYKPS